METIRVAIVVPLFNEEKMVAALSQRLISVLSSFPYPAEVIMVDDGSIDNTPRLLEQLALSDQRFQAVILSRNFGHQAALTAGFSVARATDGVMTMDADLQDPPEMIHEFYDQYQKGFDVVYGVRKERKESWMKKTAYHLFYRLMKSISYFNIPIDSGDFAFVSRRVVDALNSMPEESRYLRGMRAWVGYNQIGIPYERKERFAGESKYSIRKLIRLAYTGIFNFSEFPVKFVKRLGYMALVIAVVYFIYNLVKKYILQIPVPEGFTALLSAIILFGAIQLISIGLIGEYILRIFFQVKGRPLFIIKNHIIDKTHR